MTRRFTLLFVLLLAGEYGFGQSDFFLPQIANGRQEGGVGIRTTFVLFNPTDESAGVELSLTDNQGDPLTLTIPALGTGSDFSFYLGAGETVFLETDGEGPVQAGAAIVSATAPLGVSAVFTILNSAGAFLTEAGVGCSLPAPSVTLPVDTTGASNTGIAVFNPSFAESLVTFRLFTAAGAPAGQTTRTLAGHGHEALFVDQLFSGASDFRGTMIVEGAQPVAAVALRQNLNTLTSTTLPVTSSASQIKEFRLPQVAKGTYQGGSIRTSFLLFNLSDSQSASVDVTLTTGAGQPFPITIAGLIQNQAAFHVSLVPRGAVFLDTDSAGPVVAGAAAVVSTAPIGVSSIFSLYDANGVFQTEAGVGDSQARSTLTLPVDSTGAFDSGVAIFNPGPVESTMTVRLLDSAGTRIDSVQTTLAPSGHQAFLVRQQFGGAQLRGSLSITGTAPVSALTLRLNAVPLSYTTLPSVAGAFAGLVPRPPLLPQQVTGISAVTDTHVEISLEQGLKLSGRILGAASSIDGVFARSSDGGLFGASVESVTRRYSVAVPAGTYSLIVCYKGQGTFYQSGPALRFEDPQPMAVSSDTIRDMTLPDTPTFAVTGAVTGLGQQLVSSLLRFTRSDGAAGGDALISLDRRYSLVLPAGSYAVTLVVVIFGDFGRNEVAYQVGSIAVTDHDLTQDFGLPPISTLFGKLQVGGMPTIRAGSVISATDLGAPMPVGIPSVPDVSNSQLSLNLLGNYRGALASGRSYALRAFIALTDDMTASLIVPVPALAVTLGDNRQVNFAASAPTMVSLTGTVRGPGNQPVDGATISAISGEVVGVDGALGVATGRSNALGDFQLQVPAGLNYRITISPPAP